MGVYVLHFDPPFQHAKHYVGFTKRDVNERLAEHLSGRGNSLVYAAHRAGCRVTVVRFWKSGTRRFEVYLKSRKDVPRWCACCSGGKRVRRPTLRHAVGFVPPAEPKKRAPTPPDYVPYRARELV